MQGKESEIMQNWKKQLITDPSLNMILDSSQSAQTLVTEFISKKDPEEISTIYVKLGTLKHSLTNHLKKEVELLAPVIILNYHQTRQLRFSLEQTPNKRAQLIQAKDFLSFYNDKYNLVQTKTLQLKNCHKMLGFVKAYQKYVVQSKLLKSLVASSDESTQANSLKLSELIRDIIDTCSNNDFSGIKAYESERKRISELKAKLGQDNSKTLRESIDNKNQQHTLECVKVAHNLGVLNQSIKEYFNSNLTNVIVQTKKLLDSKQNLELELQYYASTVLKHSLDVLDLERVMYDNGFQSFFQQFITLKNLFGQFWKKVVETLEKLSTKFFAEVRNGNWVQKGFQIKINYPVIFNKMVSIVNEVNLYAIQNPQSRLDYNFIDLREQFIKGLSVFANQYHNYVKEVSQNLLLQSAKISPSDPQLGTSIINSINSKISELISKVHNEQLLLQVIHKTVFPILKKLNQSLNQTTDQTQRQTWGQFLRALIVSVKENILQCRVGYTLDISHLQHFQIPNIEPVNRE